LVQSVLLNEHVFKRASRGQVSLHDKVSNFLSCVSESVHEDVFFPLAF